MESKVSKEQEMARFRVIFATEAGTQVRGIRANSKNTAEKEMSRRLESAGFNVRTVTTKQTFRQTRNAGRRAAALLVS